MFRKIVYGFGILGMVLTAGVVALFIWTISQTSGFDSESKAYVDDAVIAIVSHWDRQELMKRASPDLIKVARPDQIDTLFTAFATLGPLIEYEGAAGSSSVMVTTKAGKQVSANYVAKVRFQMGNAVLRLGLVKVDGEWAINGFNLESPQVMENLVGRTS